MLYFRLSTKTIRKLVLSLINAENFSDSDFTQEDIFKKTYYKYRRR